MQINLGIFRSRKSPLTILLLLISMIIFPSSGFNHRRKRSIEINNPIISSNYSQSPSNHHQTSRKPFLTHPSPLTEHIDNHNQEEEMYEYNDDLEEDHLRLRRRKNDFQYDTEGIEVPEARQAIPYQGLQTPNTSKYQEECGTTRQCFDITSSSLECINYTCQCSMFERIQLQFDNKTNLCLGAKGHSCVTPAMCHSGKCEENGKCSSAMSSLVKPKLGRLSRLAVELLANLFVMIIAKAIVTVRH